MDKSLAKYALKKAKENGADSIRVLYREGITNSITLLNKDIENIHSATSSSLIFQIYSDGRYGEYSTNMLKKSELDTFIAKAVAATKIISKDDCRILPTPDMYYRPSIMDKDLKLIDVNFSNINIEKKKEVLNKIVKNHSNNNRCITSADSYSDTLEHLIMLDSNGFEGLQDRSLYSISSEATFLDNDGSKPQGWSNETVINFEDLLNIKVSQDAYENGLKMLGHKKIPTGTYSVVIDNLNSSKFISPLISAMSANMIQQRDSFLIDSLGKKIFPETFNLVDRPHTPAALGARYFDSEGIPTKNRDIISNGIVSTYFTNTYYAKKLGIPVTIDFPSVIEISPLGKNNSDAMIKDIGKGILISGFNGGNINSSTGDFSYGIEGQYFEDGKIIHPIKELNISGNIISLWQQILHIGTDFKPNSFWRMPSLAFKNVSIG
ncbi:MAG: TldD/PmbA family protein [Bacteroidales bacterium]